MQPAPQNPQTPREHFQEIENQAQIERYAIYGMECKNYEWQQQIKRFQKYGSAREERIERLRMLIRENRETIKRITEKQESFERLYYPNWRV